MDGDINTSLAKKQSVVDFLSPQMQRHYSEVPDDIKLLNELELLERFTPNPTDWQMRRNLSVLYENYRTSDMDAEILAIDIFRGVCTEANFYTRVVKNPLRLCYILKPLSLNQDLWADGTYHGLMRLRNALLTMPINEKTLGQFLNTWKIFVDRSEGPVEQVIRQNTTQVNVDGNKMVQDVLKDSGVYEKFNELKSKIEAQAKVIDVKDPE